MRNPSARPSVCEKKNSLPNRRSTSRAKLRQRNKTRCGNAPWRGELNQEGRIECVQLGRRVLRCFKTQARNLHEDRHFGHRKVIYDRCGWNIQDSMLRWQHAWRLRRNDRLAAIVRLVRWIAWHRTAALHRLLVSGHRGEAVRKLQHKERSQRQNQECHLANHLVRFYGD